MALFSKAPELSGLCDDAKWEFGNAFLCLTVTEALKNPADAGDGSCVKNHFLLTAPKERVLGFPKKRRFAHRRYCIPDFPALLI